MDRKWTHVLFAVAGMVLAWLLAKCGDWVWVYFSNANKSREAFIAGGALVLGLALRWAHANQRGSSQPER